VSTRIPARNATGDQIYRGTQVGGEDIQHVAVSDAAGNLVQSAAAFPLGNERGLIVRPISEREPTFTLTSPVSAFAASKFHLIIVNTSTATLVKVHRIVIQPITTAVTGALSGPWALRRREGVTLGNLGGNVITPVSHDSADALPSGIAAYNAPLTAPTGGTLRDLGFVQPQPDEIKLSTLDAPTMQGLYDGGGLTVYDSRLGGAQTKALRLRPNEDLELQQDATAGAGNVRVFAIFTTTAL
jgi:hypothetical protein